MDYPPTNQYEKPNRAPVWERNVKKSGSQSIDYHSFFESSAGRTRTYNPSVTQDPMLSQRGGLSHQLPGRSCRALV
jgi:hypothetical protein